MAPNGRIIHRVSLMASEYPTGSGQGSAVQSDGSVWLHLPPGKYSLSIEVEDEEGRMQTTIQLRKCLVLAEREERRIVLKQRGIRARPQWNT